LSKLKISTDWTSELSSSSSSPSSLSMATSPSSTSIFLFSANCQDKIVLIISSSTETFSSSITHPICNFWIPYPTSIFLICCFQTNPSFWMRLKIFLLKSSKFCSISQTLTSKMTSDFPITFFSSTFFFSSIFLAGWASSGVSAKGSNSASSTFFSSFFSSFFSVFGFPPLWSFGCSCFCSCFLSDFHESLIFGV